MGGHEQVIVEMDSAIGQVCIKNPGDVQAPPKSFAFDGAYYMDSTTEQMYNEIVFNLVEVRASVGRLSPRDDEERRKGSQRRGKRELL